MWIPWWSKSVHLWSTKAIGRSLLRATKTFRQNSTTLSPQLQADLLAIPMKFPSQPLCLIFSLSSLSASLLNMPVWPHMKFHTLLSLLLRGLAQLLVMLIKMSRLLCISGWLIVRMSRVKEISPQSLLASISADSATTLSLLPNVLPVPASMLTAKLATPGKSLLSPLTLL